MAEKTGSSPVVMNASGGNSPAVQAATTTTAKKSAAPTKSKKPRAKPSHPRTSEMVNAAIKSLKERGGSSLQAIKKYITSTYKVDAEKHASFIKKYLKAAVTSGALVQTKGKGAAGSFRLASAKVEAIKPKPQPVKPAAPKKSTATRKPTAPKKAAVKKPPAKKAKPTAVGEKKKKVSKGPAAKPPKPKTTATKAKTVAKAPAKKAQPKKPTVTKAKKPAAKKVAPKKK